jgi:acetyl esterase
MDLDPFLKAYNASRANEPRMSELSPVQARAARAASRLQVWPAATECSTQDMVIAMPWGNCPARLYRPTDDKGQIPLVVFFHGGGFVLFDIESHDGMARSICGGAGVAVLSVGYRLAPEHPWPAGQTDATQSVRWAIEQADVLGIDPHRVILCGDSAGANLAGIAALQLAGEATMPRLAGLALLYPVTDFPNLESRSYTECATGYGLTAADMQWFWEHYLTGCQKHPDAAALLRAGELSALPPTFVATAAYDVLRDEGEAFAQRVFAAGVLLTGRRYLGVGHNFMAYAAKLTAAAAAYQDLCHWIMTIITEKKRNDHAT